MVVRGPRERTVYDALWRVAAIKVHLSKTGEKEAMVVKNEYGESYKQDLKANNLRGQFYKCWDQSGVQSNIRFDSRGNCIESAIQYAAEPGSILDWSAEIGELNSTEYTTGSSINAIGRAWHIATAQGDGIINTFDVAAVEEGSYCC
ncbi:rhs family protein [Metarhizium acridum CQMa 102]|uniref:Rhs family protein n=1 Tax=Metarhizium acridum (strain CQMa 102) TaxID=655827 RepID=E9DXF0_METAQ|nr:rhs family protein [Metarhizium acridum CQMa 102]EFY91708.1 rhs family protein [Metarhizium acridum CQMa 102]